MATYTDQLLVYSGGYNLKVQPGDVIALSTGSITLTSGTFTGNGSGLTSLNAGNITSGSLADARLSSNVAKYTDATPTFTNTVAAAGFSGSGSLLTGLNASNLSSGTVADARLSSNIPLKNAALNAFSGDMTVGGDLTVTGAIISTTQENILIGDNFLDLLASNTSTASVKAGGFTVTAQALGTPFTATDFVAGVAGVSNPYMITSADPTLDFLAGDIISVSGSTTGKNDGQYIVLSVSNSPDNRITVKGIGTTGTSAQTPFAHNQFVAQAGETATVTSARVAAIASSNGTMSGVGAVAVPAGTFCWAYGVAESDFTDNWTSLASVSQSLQAAYNGGNTINLANGSDLTVNKPASGTAAILLESNAASSFTVDGNTLALDASRIDLNTGNVSFAKSGVIAATTAGRSVGDVVYFDSSFASELSDNNSGTAAALEVDGVVAEAGYVATVDGTPVYVSFVSAPTAGNLCWLSSTAGKATDVVPTSGRITQLGKVLSGTAVGGLYPVKLHIQYIADI